jgi:hypothetical protein
MSALVKSVRPERHALHSEQKTVRPAPYGIPTPVIVRHISAVRGPGGEHMRPADRSIILQHASIGGGVALEPARPADAPSRKSTPLIVSLLQTNPVPKSVPSPGPRAPLDKILQTLQSNFDYRLRRVDKELHTLMVNGAMLENRLRTADEQRIVNLAFGCCQPNGAVTFQIEIAGVDGTFQKSPLHTLWALKGEDAFAKLALFEAIALATDFIIDPENNSRPLDVYERRAATYRLRTKVAGLQSPAMSAAQIEKEIGPFALGLIRGMPPMRPKLRSISAVDLTVGRRLFPQQQQLRRNGNGDAGGFLAADAVDPDRASQAGQLSFRHSPELQPLQE